MKNFLLGRVGQLSALIFVANLAGTALAADSAAEAKRHFEIGKKLYKERIYDAALAEFEQSYSAGHRFTALKNVAQCHRELKNFAKALESFEKLLSDHASDLKPADRKEVEKAIEELGLVTATLEIGVTEAGASITVDESGVGNSPLKSPVRVNVGSHKVRAQKEGFVPNEQDIRVVGQQRATVALSLSPIVTTGKLAVRERNNRPIHVFVDKVDVGAAPWEGEMKAGAYSVDGKGDALNAPPQTAQVSVGARTEIILDAAATVGRVRVVATPGNATIAIDGKEVGHGIHEAELSLGEHDIGVSAAGHTPFSRKIKIEAGQTVEQDVSLVAISQPQAAGATMAAPAQDDPSGFYTQLTLAGQTQLTGSGPFYDPCLANQSCGHSNPIGGGIGLRIGYNLDPIGIEIAGLGLVDYRQEALKANGPIATSGSIGITSGAQRNEDFNILGYHGFAGGGIRAMSRGSFRITAGVTPGVAMRNYVMARTLSVGSSPLPQTYTEKASETAFAIMGDAAILIGSRTGTKFSLGAFILADFADNIMTSGGTPSTFQILPSATNPTTGRVSVEHPQYAITKGTQVVFGPTLGLHFGG